MPVDALRLIRKMRGGAQAHLLEAADGHAYVVKFSNNPQHRRILANEWISSEFLRYLGLSTPEAAVVNVTHEFLEENPDVYLQTGRERLLPDIGWHFGSRFPGDVARTVVYDFLPDVLLSKVANMGELIAMLAFDKWMGNADARQAIFFRARISELGPSGMPEQLGFVAQMVDNGYVFEGPHWRFPESAIQVCISVRRSTKPCAGWTRLSRGWNASAISRRKWLTERSTACRAVGSKEKRTPSNTYWSN
ncbi:MAG: HipA family kinase [Acidobacteriota bacterium]